MRLLLLLAALLLGGAARADVPTRALQDPDARALAYFTDTELLTHRGRKVRFYSDVLKGQVVLINFVYTHCGDACPLITRRLLEANNRLAAAGGVPVRFVSISIDPENDPPEALKAFARQHKAEQEHWWFLTGAKADVDQVVKRLGQYTGRTDDHSTLILAGNARTRHWVKISPSEPPAAIAERLRALAAEG